MQKSSPDYEYTYSDPNAGHHHQYLAEPILNAIFSRFSAASVPTEGQSTIRLLDLGCGNGSLSALLAGQGLDVVGVEESASGVAQAQANYPNCKFLYGSIYNLNFPDLYQSFDVVLAAEVIEHLFYPKELTRTAKRYLKPGGLLIVTTPYHGYLKNLALAITGKMDSHFTALWDGGHIKFFSPSTLRQLVISEGFVEPQFQFSGRVPLLWKSMICAAAIAPSPSEP